MTSGMITRAIAAASRLVPGPGASVVTEIVMMMWRIVTSVTAWGQSILSDDVMIWWWSPLDILIFQRIAATRCDHLHIRRDKENACEVLPLYKSINVLSSPSYEFNNGKVTSRFGSYWRSYDGWFFSTGDRGVHTEFLLSVSLYIRYSGLNLNPIIQWTMEVTIRFRSSMISRKRISYHQILLLLH